MNTCVDLFIIFFLNSDSTAHLYIFGQLLAKQHVFDIEKSTPYGADFLEEKRLCHIAMEKISDR